MLTLQSFYKLVWNRLLQQVTGQVPFGGDGILSKGTAIELVANSKGEIVIPIDRELVHRIEMDESFTGILKLKTTNGTIPLLKYENSWYFSREREPFPMITEVTLVASANDKATVFGFVSNGGKVIPKLLSSEKPLVYSCGTFELSATKTDGVWGGWSSKTISQQKPKIVGMDTPGPLEDLVSISTTDDGYVSFSSGEMLFDAFNHVNDGNKLTQLISSMSTGKYRNFANEASGIVNSVKDPVIHDYLYTVLSILKANH